MLLFKVESVFEIEGRGCVIAPGPEASAPPDILIRRRDPISLHRPDGSVIRTHVHEFDFLRGGPRDSRLALVLPPNVSKADVPIGSEAWYCPERVA